MYKIWYRRQGASKLTLLALNELSVLRWWWTPKHLITCIVTNSEEGWPIQSREQIFPDGVMSEQGPKE